MRLKLAAVELQFETSGPHSPGGSLVPWPSTVAMAHLTLMPSRGVCVYRPTTYRQLGKLQAAKADFGLKEGFNLERLGQPNVELNLLIAAHLMVSSRAKYSVLTDLIPGSGWR